MKKSKLSEVDNPVTFKIIVIGDSGTHFSYLGAGKTALINKYVTGEFSEEVNVTVGVDFSSKSIQVEGKKIQFQIWDTVFD